MRTVAALTGLAALTLLDISASTAQAQTFNGAYAGVHTGARLDNGTVATPTYNSSTFAFGNVPAASYSLSSASPLLGGHLGYNVVAGTNFLLGVETDFDVADNRNSYTCVSCADGATVMSSLAVGLQSTLRGRLGFVTGSTLVYGTAGFGVADVQWTQSLAFTSSVASVSKGVWQSGWVAGGGLETFVGSNSIFRTEYLYEDFGSITVPLADTTKTGSASLVAQKIRLGLSFKF